MADVRSVEGGGMDDRVGAFEGTLERIANADVADDPGRRRREAVDADDVMGVGQARENCPADASRASGQDNSDDRPPISAGRRHARR